jgi:hypothetical protein
LRRLRALVLNTAKDFEGVGHVSEELRWNQFSFLTLQSGSGSTIRIDGMRKDTSKAAIYFHCQSGLVEQFKEHYGNLLKFDGKRAIILDVQMDFPEAAIRHCILLALTHHLRKVTAKADTKNATRHHHRH